MTLFTILEQQTFHVQRANDIDLYFLKSVIMQHSTPAHYQACIWRTALDEEPPKLDPTKFGWNKDELSKLLYATLLPKDAYVIVTPPVVLRMIKNTYIK